MLLVGEQGAGELAVKLHLCMKRRIWTTFRVKTLACSLELNEVCVRLETEMEISRA